ncbi:hypothetical protein DPMN_183520 [Dreissena polymorpha]|uniref:Uncharacterized protein n=1 Tax=Dreissena polymorpha TaxID=45954 RepID=A0A9D4DII3_DREPO|nr:hypothetical protein DPMN_183520 [Dreissena polymorpha]
MLEGSLSGMVIVGRKKNGFTTSPEDGRRHRSRQRRGRAWQIHRPGFRGDGTMEIMEMSKVGGTQYAQRAEETVLGFGSTTFGV